MGSRLTAIRAWLRTRGAGVGIELLINGVLPLVIYTLTDRRLGDLGALIACSVPPIVWSGLEFVRHRRVDALSMLVLFGIACSLLALLGGGGPRFLLLRENMVTGATGVVLLVSAAIRRPMVFYVIRSSMRRNSPSEAAAFEQMKQSARFKRTMMLMTLVWGAGLIGRTATACVLVFSLSIPNYLIASPILGYAFTGGLGAWTFWYGGLQRRLGAAERAASSPAEADHGAMGPRASGRA